jgi:hypothetical protein
MNRASLVVVTMLGLIGIPSARAQVDDRALGTSRGSRNDEVEF